MSSPKADTPGVILSKIFKTLLFELGVGIDRYQHFMYNVIRRLNFSSNYKVSSLINNLSKEIFQNSISWKVFIKSLLFLGTVKFTIFLKKDTHSPIVYHTVDIGDISTISNLFSFSKDNEDKELKDFLNNIIVKNSMEIEYKAYHTVDISDISTISNLLPFSKNNEDQEESRLGKELKDFLNSIIVKNSMKIEYNEAVADYVELLKKNRVFTNKSLKGNLVKEFKKDNISWKVFIKALVVYGITNPTIGITIYDKINKHHTVSFSVNLDETML